MILSDKTESEFGYTFDSCRMHDKIYCSCDYCSKEFLRSKRNILVSNKNINKDACGGKCTSLKRKESNILIHGKDNYFKTEEFKQKYKKSCLEKYGTNNAAQADVIKQKISKTCNERYGSSSYLGSQYCKNQARQKCLEEYGVDNYAKVEKLKNKSRQTCLKKYGVEHTSKTKEFRDKVKNTCKEKYGVENPSQDPNVVKKMKETNLKKYGAETILTVPHLHQKMLDVCKEKYGVDHPSRSPKVRAKFKATCLERYGVEHPHQLDLIKIKIQQTKIDRYGTLNHNFTKTEKSIKDWLNSFGFDFKTDVSILKGKQLDMVDFDIKAAVEFCGLYWHTELSPTPRPRNYHYSKYKECLNHGIRLFTIFQDEWKQKENQCKNILKSVLGMFSRRIYARKCNVNEVKKDIFKTFCNEHHILGACNFKVAYGLFYEDELLGVMSLGRHHRGNEGIVLNRLCFKEDIQVIGGVGKLLSRCSDWSKENGYDKIITWSDNRWSAGKVYEKVGFVLDEELRPDYSYVDLNNAKKGRLSKQSFRKKAKNIPENMTEREWCAKRDLARIWDCGKKRWVYNISVN